MVFKADTITNAIYKNKEDEVSEVKINLNRTNCIYLVLVIGSLFGLAILVPILLIGLVDYLKDLMFDKSISLSDSLVLEKIEGFKNTILLSKIAQITILVLIILNASSITAWIEKQREKRMKNITTDENETTT